MMHGEPTDQEILQDIEFKPDVRGPALIVFWAGVAIGGIRQLVKTKHFDVETRRQHRNEWYCPLTYSLFGFQKSKEELACSMVRNYIANRPDSSFVTAALNHQPDAKRVFFEQLGVPELTEADRLRLVKMISIWRTEIERLCGSLALDDNKNAFVDRCVHFAAGTYQWPRRADINQIEDHVLALCLEFLKALIESGVSIATFDKHLANLFWIGVEVMQYVAGMDNVSMGQGDDAIQSVIQKLLTGPPPAELFRTSERVFPSTCRKLQAILVRTSAG